MREARQVTQLREQPDGGGELDAAHGLQGEHGWIKPPLLNRFAQGRFQALAPREVVLDGAPVFSKRDVLPVAIEGEGAYPAPMRGPPIGGPGVAHPVRSQYPLHFLLFALQTATP